jgi:hypothetical protein
VVFSCTFEGGGRGVKPKLTCVSLRKLQELMRRSLNEWVLLCVSLSIKPCVPMQSNKIYCYVLYVMNNNAWKFEFWTFGQTYEDASSISRMCVRISRTCTRIQRHVLVISRTCARILSMHESSNFGPFWPTIWGCILKFLEHVLEFWGRALVFEDVCS